MTIHKKGLAAVFLSGFCLALAQFFLAQEVTALAMGSEMVILLVTLSFFTGLSVGYKLADKLSLEALGWLAPGIFILHLSFPFSLRIISGYLSGFLPGLALIVLLFLVIFTFVSFFSVVLPAFIDSSGGGKALPVFYALEILGFASGLGTVFALAGTQAWVMAVAYQIGMALLVALILNRPVMYAITAGSALAYGFISPELDKRSLAYYYRTVKDIEVENVLSSVYSPYQKVDVFTASNKRRYIFLNGVMFYGSPSLSLFNFYLTRLPVEALKPRNVLVMGSGTMQSVAYASATAQRVTTVEIDPAVIAASRKYFADINRVDKLPGWNLVIDDGKHYLASATGKFDLIIVDIPAPYTIQTGLLYSEEFMRLAKERLNPGGALSISLCGLLESGRLMPRVVGQAIVSTFDKTLIYTPKGSPYSFALAGNDLSMSVDTLNDAARKIGGDLSQTWNKDQARKIIGQARPISWNDVRFPVLTSMDRIIGWFTPPKGAGK
ncbi:MAG: hypothetical protein HY751_10070 [Nitrospinae bacterium]|nr:hypothetical protein [Nitrospinota bacterium]